MEIESECSKKSDEELVNLSLEHSDYFLCLIKKYSPKLSIYLKRISSANDEDIEDSLQEIFIKVYTNLAGFDSSLKFSSWIYRIARNYIISWHRKKTARPQEIFGNEDYDILDNIASDFNLIEMIERNILKQDVEDILNSLKQSYREVLILFYFENKKQKEISDILKKPINTISSLISRAKKQFLILYKEKSEKPPLSPPQRQGK